MNCIRTIGIAIDFNVGVWNGRIDTNINSTVQMANSCAAALQESESDLKEAS